MAVHLTNVLRNLDASMEYISFARLGLIACDNLYQQNLYPCLDCFERGLSTRTACKAAGAFAAHNLMNWPSCQQYHLVDLWAPLDNYVDCESPALCIIHACLHACSHEVV